MNNKIEFSNCINNFLLLREWSASKLAKEINIDSSYLRKWVRGERVPSLKSDYIQQIAISISFGLESPSKKDMYIDFIDYIKRVSTNVDESKSLQELISEILVD